MKSDWIACHIEMYITSEDDVNTKVLKDLGKFTSKSIEYMPAKMSFRKSDVTHIRELLNTDGSSEKGYAIVYLRCGESYSIDMDYKVLEKLLNAHN